MWRRVLSCFLFVALCAAGVGADLREAAYRAQALLGPGVWSQVVKIKNSRPDNVRPSVVYALVFELEARLWFYAANSGTESLSLESGRLEEDKRALGPLLREIHAGFRRHEVLPARYEREREQTGEALPNGCLVESVAFLRRLIDEGASPDEARLLAYYASAWPGGRGHTVLYFEREGRRYYYDPADGDGPREISATVSAEALAIARETVPRHAFMLPDRAVFLPLQLPSAKFQDRVDRALLAERSVRGGGANQTRELPQAGFARN